LEEMIIIGEAGSNPYVLSCLIGFYVKQENNDHFEMSKKCHIFKEIFVLYTVRVNKIFSRYDKIFCLETIIN